MTKLPINLNDLLRQRTVEGDRIEYKAGWNPDPIIRTVCAFANDFENLGGGYVVIGQDCDADGQPIFPPVGLPDNQLDKIQRELLAHCQLIQLAAGSIGVRRQARQTIFRQIERNRPSRPSADLSPLAKSIATRGYASSPAKNQQNVASCQRPEW